MIDTDKTIAGRRFSKASPFRPFHFAAAAMLGAAVVVLDIYLICRYFNTAPPYAALILGLPIGIQLIYQWWRALRYRSKLRELYSKDPAQGSSDDAVIQLAITGIVDMLFYSYGIALFALILVGALLSRLEHLP